MKLPHLPSAMPVLPKRPTADERPVTPHLDGVEPDWRRAYRRRRDEDGVESAAPLAVLVPAPGTRAAEAVPAEPAPDGLPARATPRGEARAVDAPRRDEAVTDVAAQPLLPPAPLQSPREVEAARAAQPALASPTAQRVEALRRLAEPAPLARVWEVDLPAAGPAWQLRVQQAQPLAPLSVELRVPAVVQVQARQQLGELDRRLREAGHDLLRPRLRTSRSSGPVESVKS